MRLLAICLAVAVGLGCADGDTDVEADQPVADTAGEWVTLFDGTSLDAWRGFGQEVVPASWTIEDSVMTFTPREGGGGDLMTRDQFENFEFELEWRISPAGNSGIIYRATEEFGAPWMTGPEYQLLDNDAHPDAENGPDRMAGANYDMQPTDPEAVRPVGEWNQTRIVADGHHVEHWLNGAKVAEYELYSEAWETMVDGSKWADYPEYGRRLSGHIALQDHGDPVFFRNVRIRSL